MDSILDALQSGNLIAWAIVVVLLIVAIKLLGKGFVYFMIAIACFFILMQFFPGVAEPITDFIRGSWLNDPFWDKK